MDAGFFTQTPCTRLLCTYAGPGTEWLEAGNTRPGELDLQGRTIEEANAAIVIEPDRILHVPAWHVAVFTRRLRQDTPALIHRSAPVPDRVRYRLRLCIDQPG